MHTPSAYTLANTTRPSRIKRKIRGYVRANARAAAVELVFYAKEQVTTVTETNADKTPPQLRRVPRVATRGRVPTTQVNSRSCPGPRACNPARSNSSQYTSTRACVRACARVHPHDTRDTRTQFYTSYTLEAHLSTLNYTRYGYVKPIVFVNCPKTNF